MKYILKMTYKDGQDVNVVLKTKEEVTAYLEQHRKNEPYWDATGQSAFWVPQDAVRYVNIIVDKEEPKVEPKAGETKEEDKTAK